MSKNIIILFNSFWNNGSGMSGGDQMLIQIFKRIKSSFNQIHCVTSITGKEIMQKDIEKVKYFQTLKFFDKLNILINYFFRTIQSFKIFKLKNINIIYSSSDFFPDVIPAYIYKKLYPNVKWYQCIFHIYPSYKIRPGNKLKNFVAQYLQKFSFKLAKNADCIININSQVSDELIELEFKKDKIAINTPGINFDFISKIEVQDDTPYYDATFLARLNPSKGIFDLIKIWFEVVKIVPNAKLALIGGGSQDIKDKLLKEIKKKNLENNISILGYVETIKSIQIIKKSKVFLFPSHEEGFGIAIADALACRVPVIAWNLSVYDEIFENNIIKIPIGNFKLFVESVIKTIENKNSNFESIENGFNFIKKYDWEQIAQNHLKILLEKEFTNSNE